MQKFASELVASEKRPVPMCEAFLPIREPALASGQMFEEWLSIQSCPIRQTTRINSFAGDIPCRSRFKAGCRCHPAPLTQADATTLVLFLIAAGPRRWWKSLWC